ncbi:MAG TPA: hypothetical protein VKQ52_09800 [Puia sp.]|nr:hypothetical protein [Puia sp.]
MKWGLLFLLFWVCCSRTGFAQYQPATASEMTGFVGQVVQASEKNGDVVIHSECGIFSIRSTHLATFTTRMLYTGHEYTIILFSDQMIPNFKLVLWRHDASNWVRVDSSDQDLAKARHLESKFVGDMEIVKVKPFVAQEYAFQLVSMSGKNETGRYGLVIQEHETKANAYGSRPEVKSGDHFFKTQGYQWAYLKVDPVTKKNLVDGQWQTNTDEGLFMANEEKKEFQQLQPTSLASKYTINSVTTPNGITAYNLTHSSGVAATMEVDLVNKTLKIWSSANGRSYIIVYTLVDNYYH